MATATTTRPSSTTTTLQQNKIFFCSTRSFYLTLSRIFAPKKRKKRYPTWIIVRVYYRLSTTISESWITIMCVCHWPLHYNNSTECFDFLSHSPFLCVFCCSAGESNVIKLQHIEWYVLARFGHVYDIQSRSCTYSGRQFGIVLLEAIGNGKNTFFFLQFRSPIELLNRRRDESQELLLHVTKWPRDEKKNSFHFIFSPFVIRCHCHCPVDWFAVGGFCA